MVLIENANSNVSDQTVHLCSLVRAFAACKHYGLRYRVIGQKPEPSVNVYNDQYKSKLSIFFVALHPKSTAKVMAGRSLHLAHIFPGQA